MAAADGTVSFAGDVGGDMVEWVTEYATDLDDIGDGTYCFEHDCPPTAQGLAQWTTVGWDPVPLEIRGAINMFYELRDNLRDNIIDSFNSVMSP